MNGCSECRSLTRRGLLRRAGQAAGAVALADPILRNVAMTHAQTAGGTGNLLVLCELNGGFDGLSFLAPYTNPVFAANRPNLALGADDVFPLADDSGYGIGRMFPFFNELYGQGEVAIVQQVAYPDMNGSHFESQEIYKFGVRNLVSGPGTKASWYERLRQSHFDEPYGVLDTRSIGDPRRYGYPDRTYRGAAQDAFARLARLKQNRTAVQQSILDTYDKIDRLGEEIRTSTEDFVSTGEATGEFFRAAMLASANLGTQVLKLSYGGFDTHAEQDTANETLFPRLNDEFAQFVNDLQARGLWERTCVCFYSEFGRRNAENGSPGTDHGHGGHMILVGPGVSGGRKGQNVTTADLQEKSLPYYVDFRAVFSACIRDWLGFDPSPVFQFDGEAYDEEVGGELFA